MRFLQLCADPGIAPGSTKGAAQHLRGIASGLLALGHEVVTAAARPAEGPFPSAVHSLSDLGQPAVCDDGLALDRVDVVYERYSLGHRGGLGLARRLGRPLVLEVNAPLVDEARAHRPVSLSPDGAVEAAAEAELLAEADLVVTVSRPLEAWVRTRRVGPTITLGNGFEPGWFERPAVATVRAASGPLVFIGHPKPWHGADRLPRLLADLERRGHHPSVLLIGGGPGVEPILVEAARLGVDRRITVTGPLPPWEASHRLADGVLGLAPYRRIDPFYFCPLKVIDYLAAGLPVVSTGQGDVPELVGDAGIVVDPDDDDALAEAVAALLADPDRRAEMAANGRRRAHAELTWPLVATRTVEAVESLLTPAGRR